MYSRHTVGDRRGYLNVLPAHGGRPPEALKSALGTRWATAGGYLLPAPGCGPSLSCVAQGPKALVRVSGVARAGASAPTSPCLPGVDAGEG